MRRQNLKRRVLWVLVYMREKIVSLCIYIVPYLLVPLVLDLFYVRSNEDTANEAHNQSVGHIRSCMYTVVCDFGGKNNNSVQRVFATCNNTHEKINAAKARTLLPRSLDGKQWTFFSLFFILTRCRNTIW